MVNIGIVGVGFMGMIHAYALWGKGAARKVKGAKLAAICTRSPQKLAGDWSGIQGNFGPRGDANENLSGVKKYDKWEDLIKDPAIDLLDVTLPNHLHKEVTIAALQAGKHVLVEKPIAVQLKDGEAMVKAAAQAGKHLLVAQVLPFFAEFAYALEAVKSGKYGKLLGGHFKRIISKPTWAPDLMDVQKSGGMGIDLHIHDTHFIQLLCGVPKAVSSRGILTTGNYVQYVSTNYFFDDKDLTVSCTCGGMSQKGRPFTHGYEIYLESAMLSYGDGQPLTLYTADGKVTQPKLKALGPVDAFVDEIQYAVDVVSKGKDPATLSGEGALAALRLCWKEAESVRTGKTVKVR